MAKIPSTVLSFLLVFIMALGANAADAPKRGDLLGYGITGRVSAPRLENPTYLISFEKMQQLLLDIAKAPRDKAYIDAALKGLPFDLNHVMVLKLLRLADGKYYLNFNFLTLEDQQKIIDVSEIYGKKLAADVLRQRRAFDSLLAGHLQPGLEPGALAYILVGAFSLDWDGLSVTDEKGYRIAATHRRLGDVYTPWAKEKGEAVSLKGLYWGSHNNHVGDFSLTSFGDHHSLPRRALPDFLWSLGGAAAKLGLAQPLSWAAQEVVGDFISDVNPIAIDLSRAAAQQRQSRETLIAASSFDTKKVASVLELLVELDYFDKNDMGYLTKIVVLEDGDKPMAAAVLRLGRQVMVDWHRANYQAIKDELADLTVTSHGVDYRVVYTEIWHFVFGIANRELAAAGYFADPYQEGRRYQGFLPSIWRLGLDTLEGE